MDNSLNKWNNAKAEIKVGTTVDCCIVQHAPFGVLVTLGTSGLIGIIERVRMHQDGFRTPDDFPPIGSQAKATVLGFRDWSKQIELALKKKDSEGPVQTMPEELVEVGLRFSTIGELSFFGLEQTNALIAAGKRVVRVEEGRAIMKKSAESSDAVTVRFEGFSVLVVLQNDLGKQ